MGSEVLKTTSALLRAALRRPRHTAAALRAWLPYLEDDFPPGHFYSPVPSRADLAARAEELYAQPVDIPGVDTRAEAQLALLDVFAALAVDQPYGPRQDGTLRYTTRNDFFPAGDALVLHLMLRHVRPRRFVEIGSGWSSAVVLDTDQLYLGESMEMTFVDPFPARLLGLVRTRDLERSRILSQPLHEVVDEVRDGLGTGDVLLIDSSHVVRAGSDVNQLLLEVIPSLPRGVHVHLHDIGYPFEYPKVWHDRGWYWSEAYLLRALLVGNPGLRITWWNPYLAARHRERVSTVLPLWGTQPGSSLWLETM